MSILLLASACSSGQADGDTTPTTASSTVVETSTGSVTTEPTPTSQNESSDTTVPAPSIEACDLVTAEDAAAILGGEVGEANSTPVGPFSSCHYPGTGLFEFVQVQVAAGMFDESQFIDNAESGAEFLEIDAVEIPDVGDKAYWLEGILWVLSGDVTFNVWIGSSEFAAEDGTALDGQALMDAALDVTTDTARMIIERLP